MKIKIKLYEEKNLKPMRYYNEEHIESIITPEMTEWFLKRTKNHIALVKKYYDKYYKHTNLAHMSFEHDQSKFEEPERTPYILIAWNYHCKDLGKPFELFNKVKDTTTKATEHHVRTNKHHPEFWTNRKDRLIPTENRDKFDASKTDIIDVSETMPKTALIEMCADWCGMSEEKHNTPFEWADSVIDKRWKFGKEKTDFIYETLKLMWE